MSCGLGIEAAARTALSIFSRLAARRARHEDCDSDTLTIRRSDSAAHFCGTGIGTRGISSADRLQHREARWARLCAPVGFSTRRTAGLFSRRGSLREIRRIWTLFFFAIARAPAVAIIAEEFAKAAIEHMGNAEIARAEEECWEPSTQYPVSIPVHGIFCVSGSLIGTVLAFPGGAAAAGACLARGECAGLEDFVRLIEDALDLAGEQRAGNGDVVRWTFGAAAELLLESEAYKGREAARIISTSYRCGRGEIPELRVRIEAQVIDSAEFPERERGQLLNLELMRRNC